MEKKWRTLQPPHQSEKFTLEEAMEAWGRVEDRTRRSTRSRSARGTGSGGAARVAARNASSGYIDAVRNELFGHIHRCGVVQATREQQEEWMKDTIQFLSERYPRLSERDLAELEATGFRYCRGTDGAAAVDSDAAEVKRSASAA